MSFLPTYLAPEPTSRHVDPLSTTSCRCQKDEDWCESAGRRLEERNAVYGAPIPGKPAPLRLRQVALQPLGVQATVVGGVAGLSLLMYLIDRLAGIGLYDAAHPHPASPAIVIAGVAAILIMPLLRSWFGGGIGRRVETIATALTTTAGAIILEYTALHWPVISAPAAARSFVTGNTLVFAVAILIALLDTATQTAHQVSSTRDDYRATV